MGETGTINLLPKQTEAWDAWESAEVTEIGYGGAAGGGKTRLGCYLAIVIAEQFPGSRGAIGRYELKNLRLTTLVELFAIFGELGYEEGRDYTYNAQDSFIKFSNGSVVLLLDTAPSPKDPEYTRFGSLNLTWAWLEESNETPEKAKSILKTRVGRNNRFVLDGKEVIAKALWLETFNPNKGHVHRDYYKPWKAGALPAYRRFIRALPGDNPYLPAIYIENLKRADKVTRERLLEGNFDYDADPQKLFDYEAVLDLRHNVLARPPRHRPKRYLINDIARQGGDRIVLSEWEDLTLVGLEVNTFQDLEATKLQIRNRVSESRIPWEQVLSDEDGVGGGVVDGLKGSKGFLGGSRALEMWDGLRGKKVPQAFANLRSQCFFAAAELVNQRRMAVKLRYFKTNIEGYTEATALEQLEEELDAIKEVPRHGQSDKRAVIPKVDIKEQLGRSPDLCDVVMMRALFELKAPPAEEVQYYGGLAVARNQRPAGNRAE